MFRADIHVDCLVTVIEADGSGVSLEAYARERVLELQEKLTSRGVLLFRGFDVAGLAGFEAFLEAIASARMGLPIPVLAPNGGG